MKRSLVVLLLLTSACANADLSTSAAPGAGATAELPALARAHDAYLAGDFLRMTLALEDVLGGDAVDPDVRDNALALLEKAYEVNDGVVPADWSLPPGLTRVGLGLTRVAQPGEVGFSASISGHVDDPARILALRVTHGGEVVLDKATDRWKQDPPDPDDGGSVYFAVQAAGVRPFEPGVYGVHVEVAGAPAVDGRVIVGDVVARAAPRILAPGPDEVAGSNPTLSFEDFFSPAYRSFERRTLWIGVSPQGEGKGWSLWTSKPGFTDVVVGEDPRGDSRTLLSPGRHWINIIFTEKRRFGPIDVARASSTHQPFRVR